MMLLSCKYCSVFVYSETGRNCKLIIVQFSGPFWHIILTVRSLAVLHSSDVISKFRTISMFISGSIQEIICRHVHGIYQCSTTGVPSQGERCDANFYLL
jgi:hypothetical protein